METRMLYFGTVIGAAALFAAPTPAADVVDARVHVETVSSTATNFVKLPGELHGDHIVFDVVTEFDSISFTPGSVMYRGKAVDFSGKEADFVAGRYEHTVAIPNAPGTTVHATGEGIARAPGRAEQDQQVKLDFIGVTLGSSFAPDSFDLVAGSGKVAQIAAPNWDVSVMPELTGAEVTAELEDLITFVDAATGVFSVAGEGDIFARGGTATPGGAAAPLGTWGLVVQTAGLSGLGILILARRKGFVAPQESS